NARAVAMSATAQPANRWVTPRSAAMGRSLGLRCDPRVLALGDAAVELLGVGLREERGVALGALDDVVGRRRAGRLELALLHPEVERLRVMGHERQRGLL